MARLAFTSSVFRSLLASRTAGVVARSAVVLSAFSLAGALPSLPPALRAVLAQELLAASPENEGERASLEQKDTSEIISQYRFVGDFSIHEEKRPNSDYLFWRYQYPFPQMQFNIEPLKGDLARLVPKISGTGRAVEHYNIGRLQFLAGKYLEAKTTWVAAKSKYGHDVDFARWMDFLIGVSFVQMLSDPAFLKIQPLTDLDRKAIMANASQFLSLALLVKRDQGDDERLRELVPQQFYNLAAIYFQAGRQGAAFGAAKAGLEYLAQEGDVRYRLQLRRMLAEVYIGARSYLEAVQELDKAIRADAGPAELGALFNRVGDIYYDLNNFELAEEVYALAAKVDYDQFTVNVPSLVLRAESLFWLGRFGLAKRILEYALESAGSRQNQVKVEPELLSAAMLRLADAELALGNTESAKLLYFKVSHKYPNFVAGQYAKVQRACLELPDFGGNNLMHARNLLEELSSATLDPDAIELAYACHAQSYSQRDRDEPMLDRVRSFVARYPGSRFLRAFIVPVTETQRAKFYSLYDAGDFHKAADFFEKNRKVLFPEIPDGLGQRMFTIYMHLDDRRKAAEFLRFSAGEAAPLALAVLRAVYLSESSDLDSAWGEANLGLARRFGKEMEHMSLEVIGPLFFARLLASPAAKFHAPWLYELARIRSGQDQGYACELQFPILSKYKESPALGLDLKREVDGMVIKNFPALLDARLDCAISILELEMQAHGDEFLLELGTKYVGRKDWPKKADLATAIYTVAERITALQSLKKADAEKAKSVAEALFQVLVDGGYEGAQEVIFARQRLDKTRTETEQLWGD